ncbi:TonB family protein [Spirosoma koreense]
MKITLFTMLVLAQCLAFGQDDTKTIRFDPVFIHTLTKHLIYPADAEKTRMQAKIYVRFSVTEEGHIQDILILNPQKTGFDFEAQVLRAFKKLPPLSHRYAGGYVLPIAFVFENEKPLGSLPASYYSGYSLLNEFQIVGDVRPYKQYLPILQRMSATGRRF